MRLLIKILLSICIFNAQLLAQDELSASQAKIEMQKVIVEVKKEVEDKFNKGDSLETVLSYLEELELSSKTLSNEVTEQIKKAGSFNSLNARAKATTLNRAIFLEGKQCRKSLNACAEGNDQCCDGNFCRETQDGSFKCVPKVKAGHCDPTLNQCEDGSCRMLLRYSDINLCTTYGDSCTNSGECCSGSCNKDTKKCEANYQCTTCLDKGSKVSSGVECCDGLYPNENGICVPIIPITFFYPIKSFLNLFVSNSYAASSAEDMAEYEKLLAELKAKAIQASDSATSSKLVAKYTGDLKSCLTYVRSETTVNCYSKVSASIQSTVSGLNNIIKQQASVKEEAAKLKKKVTELGATGDSGYASLLNKMNNDARNCAKNAIVGVANGASSLQSGQECLSSVQSEYSGMVSDIDSQLMQLKVQLAEEGKNVEFYSPGRVQSDASLYKDYDVNAPLLSKITVSDMNSCRVNLFGDYLANQSNDYFNVVITLLGMDFITSGGGVEDYFDVNNWNYQTQAQEEDIQNFDADRIKEDKFNSEYASLVKDEIAKYYRTLTVTEKKIFGYLFKNSFVGAKEKSVILDYYMSGKGDQADSLFTLFEPPAPETYNLFKITRFESVKFKLFLYKMYGKLKQKSIEMMCRCVDTMGPIKGDAWLEKDVEANYIRECRGRGKYNKFVMMEDTSCRAVDNNGNCVDAQSKEYIGKVLNDKEEEFSKDHVNSATKDETTGKVDVKYNDPQGENAGSLIANDFAINELDKLKQTKEKISKADKFIVNGKVTFEAERGENKAGLGEGLLFTEFLRDMAMMKVEALADAASNNVFSISQTLSITTQFISTYNWSYQKTRTERFDKVKKYTWAQLVFAFLIQLITGSDTAGGAGYYTSGTVGTINFKYDGQNVSLQNAIKDSLQSLNLRPSVICEKRKYKSKTWKVARIPIGKKYYYKCIRNHIENNSVCNDKVPVGLCLKSVYVTDQGGGSSFIIDPFIPHGSTLVKNDNFLKNKTVRTLENQHIDQIKAKAKEYIKSQFFEYSDAEADQFADFVFKYHFWYPKKARLIRYMTQGLIPYYERLTEKAFNLNMAMYSDLFNTSMYALKMHNVYVNTDRNIENSTRMSQDLIGSEVTEIEQNPSAGIVGHLGTFAMHSNISSERLDINTDGFRKLVATGLNSSDQKVQSFSNALKNSISGQAAREKRINGMKDYLSKKGKSSEYEKLLKIKKEREDDANKISENLNSSLKQGLGLSDSQINSTSGTSLASLRRGNGDKSEVNKGPNKGAEDSSAIKLEGGDGLKSRAKGGNSLIGDSTDKKLEDQLLDFSDLEGGNIEGIFLGANGEKLTAEEVKRYLTAKGINISKMDEPSESGILKENEREGISIFDKLSRRYERSAFPRFLTVKKKSE
ncbi:hypothetical protein [Bacteriovorax sp. Seq25_V]|uniref:hypothetical protein n=1 Tax=Bacteriovorax sp. Seq25_V TaxID=1201288 RepID=UPI00038A1CFC|nr:hypothetical protein [Bacteriovorax sp. Seq25_V]EQC47733.1 hypothetical protein M900_A0246 [Bacteriovorax sp. Seq25_V]